MTILAIETSCDETSIAIQKNGKLLSLETATQIQNHAQHGGVMPELASRLHLRNLNYVAQSVFQKAGVQWGDISLIAYTSKPGLLGCLHTGKIFAETAAAVLGVPVMPINHLEGHVYAAAIDHKLQFPMLSLLVSGGHTILYYLPNHLQFIKLGETLDDALGECYDKIGRLLGFTYPAGAEVDRYAQQGAPIYKLPIPRTKYVLDFSFSGLKTAAFTWIHQQADLTSRMKHDFCASLQSTIVKIIAQKIELVIQKYPNIKTLSVGGGVAANSSIRALLNSMHVKHPSIKVVLPPLQFCTDNAAMIAQRAWEELKINNTV